MMRATTLSLLLVSAQHALAATDDHAGHDHSSATKHEWAGLFKVDTASHTWKMQKVGGKFAEATMQVVMLPSAGQTAGITAKAALEALEVEAKHSFGMKCSVVEAGETIVPKEDACFELHFDHRRSLETETVDNRRRLDASFTIDTSAIKGTYLGIFAQHNPKEFERDAHYLTDATGKDVEAVATEGGAGHAGHEVATPPGLSTGAIVGIIAGAAVAVLLLAGLVYYLKCKKPSTAAADKSPV